MPADAVLASMINKCRQLVDATEIPADDIVIPPLAKIFRCYACFPPPVCERVTFVSVNGGRVLFRADC